MGTGLSASLKGAWSNNRLVTVLEVAGGQAGGGQGGKSRDCSQPIRVDVAITKQFSLRSYD